MGSVKTRWVRLTIGAVYYGTDPDTAISKSLLSGNLEVKARRRRAYRVNYGKRDRTKSAGQRRSSGDGKTVAILGVPLSYGQSMAGVHLGPAAIRVAGVAERIASLGYEVNDRGDLPVERSHSLPGFGEKLKYLNEIYEACERLSNQTESIIDAGELPLTIGGDHSIAIGSLAGVVKGFSQA